MNDLVDIELIERKAKEIVEKGKEHVPMVFLESEGEIDIKVIPFKNDKEKEIILNILRDYVQKKNIKRYWVVMESWLGNNPEIRPRRDINRREALTILEFNSDFERKALILKFTRDKNGNVSWEERNVIEGDKIVSRWDFYREDVVEERMEELKKELNEKREEKDGETNKE